MKANLFFATNGLWVTFRCRDAPKNYYQIGQSGDCTGRELCETDSGERSILCGDQIPDSYHEAMRQYHAQEAAEYAEWRQRNAYLFA